ncbi:hypothetical protein [Bifidobacterium commune]|uniref:hypothetical protein n=2 Tax=Bifidobacterium commune TaxID=1505727 RepID=UPI000B882B8F|nr:hypothetical protein [Bifidobacterium commune]
MDKATPMTLPAVDIIETSESKGINGSHCTSIRKNQRALLDRNELERLPTNTCIYLLRGVRPFISKKSL